MKCFFPAWRWFKPSIYVAAWLCLSALMLAEASGPTPALPPATVGEALRSLAARSAIAFTGRVVRVDRTNDVVAVTFTVEESLIGLVPSTYTLREWAGLWPMGQSRYILGARVAIFLRAPGPSGLSSPVDGLDSVVSIIQQAADQPPLLDIRRIAARVKRSVGSPIAGEQNGAMLLSDARLIISRQVPFEPIRRPLPVGVVEFRIPVLIQAPAASLPPTPFPPMSSPSALSAPSQASRSELRLDAGFAQ